MATEPPLSDQNRSFRKEVADERHELLAFYEGTLAAYARDRTTWSTFMTQVRKLDPDNAYYSWFLGGSR